MSDRETSDPLSVGTDETVDAFDLDLTLFDTEAGWFGPLLGRLVLRTGRPRPEVDAAFAACNRTTFTFPKFLGALGVPESERDSLEAELRDDLARRANDCLFPGVLELLEARSRAARLVLVTAGDEAWQRWKFDCLTELHPFFNLPDRHFVPLLGSKADRLVPYERAAQLSFVDDSPRWLLEAHRRLRRTRLVRATMTGGVSGSDHAGDGREWDVACSAREIHQILSQP